jgi:hypothetical protein
MSATIRIFTFIASMGMLAVIASAQEGTSAVKSPAKIRKHEIGADLFSWINVHFGDEVSGEVSYANGLLYKLHLGQNVLRAGCDVFRYRYEEGSKPEMINGGYPWYHYAKGKYTITEARIGYERRLCTGRLQPFLGVEFAYRWVSREGTYEGVGDFIPYRFSGVTNEKTQQYFLSPLFGLNYRPCERFSISIEARYSFGASRTKDEVSGYTGKWDDLTFADPLRTVSVNYHFR